jgi:hypothetical protein
MEVLRTQNRYIERVVDVETGELVHQDEGPLTEHTGHGEARRAHVDEVFSDPPPTPEVEP